MLLWVALATAMAGIVAAVYTLKSMRPVNFAIIVIATFVKCGVSKFLIFTGLKNKKMRPTPVKYTTSDGFEIMAPNSMFWVSLEPALKLKTRNDDVFVATYPKAGTTWIQEITWLICNHADTEAAKRSTVSHRSPFLETVDMDKDRRGIQSIESWPTNSQRIIKTHLPYELLPEELTSGKKGKIICVARNPKDLCVSYYYFHVGNYGMPEPGTWSEFLSKFCSGEVTWGSCFTHILKYWEEYQKNREQIYFTTYEALKKDLRSEVASIAKFLEKELSDKQLDAIAEHCTFDSMSKNDQTNYTRAKKLGYDFKKVKFMRKGQVGDWKNHFTINENAAFDAMYQERMKGTGLDFTFEL